jgi:hypothetical protein
MVLLVSLVAVAILVVVTLADEIDRLRTIRRTGECQGTRR